MGQSISKSNAGEASPAYSTELTDSIKARIAFLDDKKNFKPLVKEAVASIKPRDLKKTIEKAKEESVAAYAPKPTCIDYSIFEDSASESWGGNAVILDFKNSAFATNHQLNKCLGSIYGMAIADSWGHVLEFVPVQYEKTIIQRLDKLNFKAPGVFNKFGLKVAQYTDDTSMGLCLADTLLVQGHVDPFDLRKRFVMWWYLGYNNAFRHDQQTRVNKLWFGRSVGLGGQISHSLHGFIENPTAPYTDGPEDMSGNGSIMRLCPLPIFYRDEPSLEFVVSEAMKQSFTTHSGIQSAECAALLSFVIVAALRAEEGVSGREFLDTLEVEPMEEFLVTSAVKCIARSKANEDWSEDKYNTEPGDQDWNWKDAEYRYSPTRSKINPGYVGGYACDNLGMALHCVYHSSNYEEAVLRAINRCGDADTVGSVTGQIAGALYGLTSIPVSALECLTSWDPHAHIGHRIFKMLKLA